MIVRRKYLCGSKNVISARKTTGDKHPHHIVCTCCCHVCSSTCANIKSTHFRSSLTDVLSLTLARACAAKGYCSRSVGRSVCPQVFSRTVAAVDTIRGYVGTCM